MSPIFDTFMAANYDRATRRAAPVRVQAVAALELRAGDVVLDVARKSGVCVPLFADPV